MSFQIPTTADNSRRLAGILPTGAGLALLDDLDAAAQRTTLGLGSLVTQAANAVAITGGSITGLTTLQVADDPYDATGWNGSVGVPTKNAIRDKIESLMSGSFQPLDAELTALAGLTSAADKLPYFTGNGTAGTADLSAFGRTLIDDADASAARTTLGLGTLATANAAACPALSVFGDIASYNAYTGISDYDRGRLSFQSNVLTLATENAGSYGTARNIAIVPAGGTLKIDSGAAHTYVAMDGPAGTGKSLIQWNEVTATNICGLEWSRAGSFTSRLRYDGTLGDLVWYNVSSGSEVEKWRLSLNGAMTVYGTFIANDVQLGVSGSTARSLKSSTYAGGEPDSIQLQTFSGTGDNMYSRLILTKAPSGSPGVAHVYTVNGTLLAIGGITSSFPCLKNSSSELHVRLADDGDFTFVRGKLKSHANAVAETPTATHTITIYDGAGTAYKVLAVAA